MATDTTTQAVTQDRLNAAVDELSKDIHEVDVRLGRKIDTLSDNVADLARIMNDRMGRIEGDVSTLKDEMALVKFDVAATKAEVSLINARMDRIEGDVALIKVHLLGESS